MPVLQTAPAAVVPVSLERLCVTDQLPWPISADCQSALFQLAEFGLGFALVAPKTSSFAFTNAYLSVVTPTPPSSSFAFPRNMYELPESEFSPVLPSGGA